MNDTKIGVSGGRFLASGWFRGKSSAAADRRRERYSGGMSPEGRVVAGVPALCGASRRGGARRLLRGIRSSGRWTRRANTCT